MSDISIIIPTYNRKELLAETLDSIFAQTLPASEIIVVDDHSTDGTLDWLKSKYQGRIKAVLNEGKGPGAARNIGLKLSSGRYVKFFDSDDLMTNNMLEVQLTVLNQSEKDFVYSPYFYAHKSLKVGSGWIAKNNTILNYKAFSNTKKLYQWMTRGLFIAIPGMLFRRKLLDRVGPWRTDVTNYEDWDYLWRVSQIEPFPEHTNACAFIYRQHLEQSTINHFTNKQRDKEASLVFSELLADYKKNLTPLDRIFLGYFYKRVSNNVMGPWSKVEKLLYRVYQKQSRMRSDSDEWMHFYGAIISKELIHEFISLTI